MWARPGLIKAKLDETTRVKLSAYIERTGLKKAAKELKVSRDVLEELEAGGMCQQSTVNRFMEHFAEVLGDGDGKP